MNALKITTNHTKEIVDNKVCDALRCNSKPDVRINLDCNQYGLLTIFVCKPCSLKFRGE